MQLEKVGHYRISRSIGKGGMGEVFLASDPVCEREVALKLMRPEWVGKKEMVQRFMREARIAAQLSHPSIIPIYSIEESEVGNFYTMPHIEGDTLKALLRKPLHPITSSIPALMRIFLNICSAIAYAHSRGIVHRDLKPENIIIGKYGEVILLDWGLAEYLNEKMEMTGAIPGTIAYMAPELAFGERVAPQTDIYSLGVILYQILALRLPFHRTTIKDFRRTFVQEQWIDPQEVAPERDITQLLSQMAKKCLHPKREERYQGVEEIIRDVERYNEGLPEWGEACALQIERKEDWEFQENVAFGRHMAINRGADLLEWVNLMISKSAFPGNLKIELEVELGKDSQGLGILFCVPDSRMRKNLEEGFCLWVGEGARLYRSGVEVMRKDELILIHGQRTRLKLEKIENQIDFFIDDILKMRFHSHIPLSGNQVGLLLRDGDIHLKSFGVSLGSQQAMVNCLAVPDAFLARKNYAEALVEYRKISHSFSGRAEGREATFRAGLTLLEEGKNARQKGAKEALFSYALEEFGKLHGTPGAPLEYMGKALVYSANGEIDEEAKCLELALRKFPKHPLKPIVVEHLISRLYASSQKDREATYYLAYLALRYLPDFVQSAGGKELLELLAKHLEPLPFMHPVSRPEIHMAIELAFWLGRPLALAEMINSGLEPLEEENALLALIQLRQEDLVKARPTLSEEMRWLLGEIPKPANASLQANVVKFDVSLFEQASDFSFLEEASSLKIWALLLDSKWKEAENLLRSAPAHLISQPTHPLFFLQGCLLIAQNKREEALSHLLSVSESPSPPTSALLSHYLLGRIAPTGKWARRAFFWEKCKLLQQMQLFAHCSGQKKPSLRSQLANLHLDGT